MTRPALASAQPLSRPQRPLEGPRARPANIVVLKESFADLPLVLVVRAGNTAFAVAMAKICDLLLSIT